MLESRTCLLPMIRPESKWLLRMYQHYKSGLLPHAGGLLDQPHFYLEAMEFLSGIEQKLLAEKAEKIRNER